MDKYEYNLKLEEITKLADQGYYEDAADIIDTIDWRRVRNVRTLCMISEIYEEVGRLQDSKALLLRAYRKSQAVRSILFHLTEISVKLREFDDAAEFYSEFVEAAPHDNSRYLLKYMIYRGRGAAIEDQIEILEEYNQKEYTEKYAYELAKLYYRAGQKEKCVDACDDLVVWFRQGKYVIRALELKQRIKALTPVQQAIYDNRNEATMPKAEMVENVAPDLEKAILENMPESSKEVITDDVISVTEKEIAQSVAEHTAEKEENDNYGIFAAFSENQEKTDQEEQDFHKELPVTTPEKTVDNENAAEKAADDAEVDEKIVDDADSEAENVSKEKADAAGQDAPAKADKKYEFNTEDLQAELAKSMRDILSGIQRKPDESDIIEPMNDVTAEAEEAAEEVPAEEIKRNNIDDILLSMSLAQKEAAIAAVLGKKVGAEPQPVKAAESHVEEVAEVEPETEVELAEKIVEVAPEVEPQVEEVAEAELEEAAPIEKVIEEVAEPEETSQVEEVVEAEQEVEVQPVEAEAEHLEETEVPAEVEPQVEEVVEAEQEVEVQPIEEVAESELVEEVSQVEPETEVKEATAEDASAKKAALGNTRDIAKEIEAELEKQAAELEKQEKEKQAEKAAEKEKEAKKEAAPVKEEDVAPTDLTEEQKYNFSYFATVAGLSQQIASALYMVMKKMKSTDQTSRVGNLIILGAEGSGKSTLGIRFAKTISEEKGEESVKIAKIYAEDFNKKDIPSTVAKIAGGTLIIEEAGDLDDAVVEQLSKAMEFRTDALLVVLEDEKKYLKELFEKHPDFAEKFTSEIVIPVLTNDELVEFGRTYAYEEDYTIDEEAIPTLYERISELQEVGRPVTVIDVKEIVDEAIRQSEKIGFRKLSMVLSKKRYDADDRVILYEKDFR